MTHLERAAMTKWDAEFIIPPDEFRETFQAMIAASHLSKSAIARRLHISRNEIVRWSKSAPHPLKRRAVIAALHRLNQR